MISKTEIIIIIICVIILATYSFTGIFCFPSGDDFDYACLGRSKTNFIDVVLNERKRWNGRYISNFLVIGSPLNLGGISLYKLMPTILILCICIGSFIFFKLVINVKTLLISLVSTTIIFSIMPDITEGIYWYTGAITYIPGGILFLLSIGLLYKYWFDQKKWLIVPIIFFQILGSGFNEIIPILSTTTFIFIWLYNLKRWDIALLSIFQFGLLYYVISAPGNSVRNSFFTEQHQIWFSFQMAWQYTIRFIGEWMLNPAIYLWIITLIFSEFPEKIISRLSFLKRPLVLLFVLLGPTYLSAFGPLWSTGQLGQYRTENLASYFYIVTLSIVIIANKEFIKSKFRFTLKSNLIAFWLSIFLLIWKNQFFLFKELATGEIINFEKEMETRIQLLEQSENKDVYLSPIVNRTKTLFVYPITDNPKDWKNQCYSNFYRNKKIYKK